MAMMPAGPESVSVTSSVADGEVPRRLWLALGFGFPGTLLLVSLEPQWRTVPSVSGTLQATGLILAGWLIALVLHQRRTGSSLDVRFRPIPSHYVQAVLQTCIYAYWGWYWRPVYDHVTLIVAQIVLAYGLDMLLSLTRRGRWAIGFGPFPIILSTNLFLLFRPEWYYLQFLMVAVGILGKEFIRWERDGRNTHIFNPSAFSLFVFSLVLILTGTTDWTFGEDIATTLNRPPNIYVQIFLIGLVVQFLFSVTLVTLMSALALIVVNLAYTEITGVYHFVDSNIPIAVFLGLHLLITDPATSPRTALGKAAFGVLYGACVFILYGLLSWIGEPTFYDKLLCVPALNLLVPLIDKAARRVTSASARGFLGYSEIPVAANRLHMILWIGVFGLMYVTGFVGRGHPGNEAALWEQACADDLRNGCQTLFNMHRNTCIDGNAIACLTAASLAADRPTVSDGLERLQLLARGCDLAYSHACEQFRGEIEAGGKPLLEEACKQDDLGSCFVVGLVDLFGVGVEINVEAAMQTWNKACDGDWARACGYLGEMYLLGKNVGEDPVAAGRYFDQACGLGYQPSCTTLGLMFLRGHGVPLDQREGRRLLHVACRSGWQFACSEAEKLSLD